MDITSPIYQIQYDKMDITVQYIKSNMIKWISQSQYNKSNIRKWISPVQYIKSNIYIIKIILNIKNKIYIKSISPTNFRKFIAGYMVPPPSDSENNQ
jgi:hypothetical protein